ncbi:RluA family pseudouridine synthase [Patescibacteria group bacterium]|nr:RluA family pseudouridine synthase [Patescibacteria group bacterium]
MQKIKITQNQTSERLDKFLNKKLDISRSQIQKFIKNEKILVNNKKKATHYFLKVGDEISVNIYQLTVNKKNKKILNKIKIIAETDDYLVINKPSGLLVHPTDNNQEENTLVDWLIKKYPEIKKLRSLSAGAIKGGKGAKAEKLRPGIVHRLDRGVSGLMVIAKNQKTFNSLKKQFQTRKIKKNYIALVHNEIEQEHGTIERPIARSKKTGLMIAKSTADKQAKPSITEFEILQRFKNYTLLKINLKTGRTHQIRVHLKSIGHSVVGDTLYQTRDQKHKKQKFNLNRIFLCATSLSFKDLEKNSQEFKINLPIELKAVLKNLKFNQK